MTSRSGRGYARILRAVVLACIAVATWVVGSPGGYVHGHTGGSDRSSRTIDEVPSGGGRGVSHASLPAGEPSGEVVALQEGNLLQDPGFEGPYVARGASELVVAEAWSPWWSSALTRPEYKDEAHVRLRGDGGIDGFSIRVFHGHRVQKQFTSNSPHDAGVFQTVPVSQGDRYRFSAWALAWSSDCDDPCISPLEPCRVGSDNTHGTYRVQVGIDPTGAEPGPGEGAPATVIWSAPIVFEAYDKWFRLTVEAEASADRITVYTRGNPEWPVKHNDSYWDDARLEAVGPPPVLQPRLYLPSILRPVIPSETATGLHGNPVEHGTSTVLSRRGPNLAEDGASLTGAAPVLRGSAAEWDPVPPGADVRIEYPVRAFPDQENFRLPTCSDLEFESVLLQNHGVVDVDLEGWTLEDRDGNEYVFPDVRLPAEGFVRVWSKSGPDTTYRGFADLYWGLADGVWNGPSESAPWDVASLKDDAGTVVAERGYP